MEERDFFDEKGSRGTHAMTCPHCGQQGEYRIHWVVRRKKAQLPRGADDRDVLVLPRRKITWSVATTRWGARM